jgi:LPXTG-site transpeptidase (sortase) family protein
MIIRNFQKGRVHNLYDHNIHKTFHGVLLFTNREKNDSANFEQLIDEVKQVVEEKRIETGVKPIAPVSDDLPTSKSSLLLNDTEMKIPVQKNSLINHFFAVAFRIDTAFFGLLKVIFKLFDALFKKVDRGIDWFDKAIIEGNLFHSFSFPKIQFSRKMFPISPFTKKQPISSKLKNTVEISREQPKKALSKAVVNAVANAKTSTSAFTFPKIHFSLGLSSLKFPSVSIPKFRLTLALICFLISLGSVSLLVFPLVSAEMYSIIQFGKELPSPSPTPFRYNSYYQEENDKLYPITEFRLSVPKINLESNIVENVDPKLEDEYKEKLQFGVAHAKGSYLPAENGPVYLFAHSTDTVFNIARFNAKFFSVRELEKGDEIKIYFNGKEYIYIVADKYVINPKEVDIIQQAKTDLILQTCWPPGTDWQRLIVTAERKDKGQSL